MQKTLVGKKKIEFFFPEPGDKIAKVNFYKHSHIKFSFVEGQVEKVVMEAGEDFSYAVLSLKIKNENTATTETVKAFIEYDHEPTGSEEAIVWNQAIGGWVLDYTRINEDLSQMDLYDDDGEDEEDDE